LIELVKTPARTLLDKTGDCDDFAVLLAALLRANLIPVRFAVVRTPGHKFFNHVFLEASADDGASWIALDGTLPGAKLGKVAPVILGRINFDFRCPQ
jgi:transglutaminase-like putative cysteine protease